MLCFDVITVTSSWQVFNHSTLLVLELVYFFKCCLFLFRSKFSCVHYITVSILQHLFERKWKVWVTSCDNSLDCGLEFLLFNFRLKTLRSLLSAFLQGGRRSTMESTIWCLDCCSLWFSAENQVRFSRSCHILMQWSWSCVLAHFKQNMNIICLFCYSQNPSMCWSSSFMKRW